MAMHYSADTDAGQISEQSSTTYNPADGILYKCDNKECAEKGNWLLDPNSPEAKKPENRDRIGWPILIKTGKNTTGVKYSCRKHFFAEKGVKGVLSKTP